MKINWLLLFVRTPNITAAGLYSGIVEKTFLESITHTSYFTGLYAIMMFIAPNKPVVLLFCPLMI